MCINEKNQCRYCEVQEHVKTDFCDKAVTTGRVCLANSFQTLGNAYTKGPYGYFFNADKLCISKFKTISCGACHKIELEVLKTLPGRQSLYVYNNDKNLNSQRLNDGVVDGTSQVVRFGWPAWEERLNTLTARYAAMAEDREHSGLTDPENETDDESVTLNVGVTPPSPPQSPKSPQEQRTRANLVAMQELIRDKLNEQRKHRFPHLDPLNATEAIIKWGGAHPILRVKPQSSSITTITRAIKKVKDDWHREGELSSTQEEGFVSVADRHDQWAEWVARRKAGLGGLPPGQDKRYTDIDRMYRQTYSLQL
jgi:hypothetical protein